jgi:CRP-like cAMP-binding protein
VLSLQDSINSNQLLNHLSLPTRLHFLKKCELISLNLGVVLGNTNDEIHHVYCPINCIISSEKEMLGSHSVLISLIGNEGLFSIGSILGLNILPCHATVRKSGQALRMSTINFAHEIKVTPMLAHLLQQYTFVAYGEAVQTAACNLFHLLENRLARLLLMFQDRSKSNELLITQDLLSQMLGVRRVGVTKAAGALQDKALIHYSRGHVMILDRLGLIQMACSCYQADLDRYAHIMHIKSINEVSNL